MKLKGRKVEITGGQADRRDALMYGLTVVTRNVPPYAFVSLMMFGSQLFPGFSRVVGPDRLVAILTRPV